MFEQNYSGGKRENARRAVDKPGKERNLPMNNIARNFLS